MIKKILVANRGEIAVRVMRSCREMEITSIAIFSEADRTAKHVLYADEAYCVGPAASKESYLNIEKIIEVAKAAHADAIHPGYGFLSENATFARRCQEEGIIFIGPNPETMEAMGDKIAARIKMIEAGVPVVPGTQDNLKSVEEAVTRMDGVRMSCFRHFDDFFYIQITLFGCCRPYAISFVCIKHMLRGPICFGEDSDTRYLHLPAGAHHPYGNFTAIGY